MWLVFFTASYDAGLALDTTNGNVYMSWDREHDSR